MGLFNRTNSYEKAAQDIEEAMKSPPARPATKQTQAAAQAPVQRTPTPQQAPTPAVQAAPAKANYSIEDAILLMRDLPDSKKEMVVAIVQKTLISAKININALIDDAAKKIDRLELKNAKFEQEISELEEAISQRKIEMDRNYRDINETREVRESFVSTYKSSIEGNTPRLQSSIVDAEPIKSMNLGSILEAS